MGSGGSVPLELQPPLPPAGDKQGVTSVQEHRGELRRAAPAARVVMTLSPRRRGQTRPRSTREDGGNRKKTNSSLNPNRNSSDSVQIRKLIREL